MEKDLFDNLMQGLNEALEYAKGDTSKGRSVIIETDEETEFGQLFYQKFDRLPLPEKKKAMQYVDQLLHASG